MNILDGLGYTHYFSVQFDLLPNPNELTPARVSATSHGLYQLVGGWTGLAELSGKLRERLRPLERPTTGDWVAVTPGAERATIRHVLDRRTLLKRRAAFSEGTPQAIAANVDVFFIVTSANLELNPRRLERYLTAVWDSGADPVLVLNKVDLISDAEPLCDTLNGVAAGAPVVRVSAVSGAGMTYLLSHFPPESTVSFIGSSGVGKSTLANRLLGQPLQATQAVGAGAKGRHTTTQRELIVVPGRGALIDTPGMREFGVLEDEGGLDVAFADIARVAERCRFRNCQHEGEPACAVIEAAETGEIAAPRLASYHKLKREIAAAQRRLDPVLAANTKRRWKAIAKANRKRFR